MRSYIKCALAISKDTQMTVKQILDTVENHLRQRRNIALDRVAFVERRQQEGESFDNFYVSIKKLAEEADLCGDCLEQRLVTRIMSGIRCKELKQKLLALNPFPALKEVIDTCRSYESSIRDCCTLEDKSVHKVSNYKNFKKKISNRINLQPIAISVTIVDEIVTPAEKTVQQDLQTAKIAIGPDIGKSSAAHRGRRRTT